MEIFIFIISIILFLLILFSKDDNKSLEDLEQELDIPNFKSKEEMFYHPVTGYRGTKSEMDTYIINRERKLNESK